MNTIRLLLSFEALPTLAREVEMEVEVVDQDGGGSWGLLNFHKPLFTRLS